MEGMSWFEPSNLHLSGNSSFLTHYHLSLNTDPDYKRNLALAKPQSFHHRHCAVNVAECVEHSFDRIKINLNSYAYLPRE